MGFLLSFFGPVFFAIKGLGYLWLVPGWAIYCCAVFLWRRRAALAKWHWISPVIGASKLQSYFHDAVCLLLIIGTFVGLHSAVYFAVRELLR